MEFYEHSSAEELPVSGEYDTSHVSIAVRKYLRKPRKQKERFVLATKVSVHDKEISSLQACGENVS